MLGQLLEADLKELVAAGDWNALAEAFEGLDDSDIGELLVDLLDHPGKEEAVLFRVLPRERAANIFSYLPLSCQEQLVKEFSTTEVSSILNGMTPDDRTRLLQELPDAVTRKLLDSLSPEELKSARNLLGYPEKTAGRYMTPEYAAIRPEMTAHEALDYIRKTGRGKETLNVVYIVDEKGLLIEDLRLGSLVLAEGNIRVAEIEDRPLVAIPATATGDEVVEAFEKYDRVALPVVDSAGHMLGIITHDDVLEFAERKATAEIQKIGGSEALDAPYLNVGFASMVKKRGGWLCALFLGEMLTATAMGYFQAEIEKAAVVALFVPLIISSGGNSGSQGTSLIIRSLALGEIKLRDWWRVFGRELRTGLALGLLLGSVGFVRIGLWQMLSHVPHIGTFFCTSSETGKMTTAYGAHWMLLGLTVFIALIGVITWGTLAGSMLPFILRRLGFDPATSSAPFVATLVDVTGLIIYFTVAMIVLHGTLL